MPGKRLTNREILELLLDNRQNDQKDYKKLTQNQANLSGQLSNLENKLDESNVKQELINQKILNWLQDNPDTGEKGVISTQKEQGEDIEEIKTNIKVTNGKIAVGVLVLTSLGGFFTWLFGIFDR